MAFEWYVPPTVAFPALANAYARNIHAGVVAIANRRAPEIEEWMKANHPWTNRTGAAEAGLHTVVQETANSMVQIILSHGADVDYGIWLEVANSGNYAVIAPAVDVWGVTVWNDVQRLLR